MNLYQVQADGPRPFVAGFCTDAKGEVWAAAPIIGWMKDKPLEFLKQYCQRKGWKLVKIA